jgi:hypothetical protein
MPPDAPNLSHLLKNVAQRAADAGVFGTVATTPTRVECAARAAAAPAWFRLDALGNDLWVSLVTPDRYLSQSIELDLVHTGDKLEDLLEEELVDLGFEDLGSGAGTLRFEHFRSDDKLFTFRSKLPVDPASPKASEVAATCLLAYEACFRRLGDMAARDEDS